jgi:hypothetical protein
MGIRIKSSNTMADGKRKGKGYYRTGGNKVGCGLALVIALLRVLIRCPSRCTPASCTSALDNCFFSISLLMHVRSRVTMEESRVNAVAPHPPTHTHPPTTS